MSKGPGRIERAIAAALDGEPDNAFTTEDLCDRVYPGINRVEKKHRVAVLRAANNVCQRRDNTDCMRCHHLGGMRVFYNVDNVMSYAMACLKVSGRYRCKDDRWFRAENHTKWFRNAMGLEKGYSYRWPRDSEADMRATLAEGGRDHERVVPGGAWWKHTQHAIAVMEAKRGGDTARLEELEAKRKAEFEASIAALKPTTR